jgi:Domain of unknown function (DUF4920)
MKVFNSIFTVGFILILSSCGKKAPDTAKQVNPVVAVATLNPQAYKFYGDSISLANAIAVDSLEKLVKAKGQSDVTVTGEIFSTCQSKGCWMKVLNGNDKIQVMAKDHAFFLPIADFKNKKVVFSGTAFYDTTSVDDLKEYAADEKLPVEEIAKITQPKVELSFIATGIAIEKAENEINKVQ